MEKRILIVVLGNSLLMDSVASNLRDELALTVMRKEISCINSRERLKAIQPDLIIFELDAPRPCTILSLLSEQPSVRLIGIDTNCSRVVEIVSALHFIESLTEFNQLIQLNLTQKKEAEEDGKSRGEA
ncbi:MAG: hypothetical protein AB1509_08030 [Chloroflexota bacterium]